MIEKTIKGFFHGEDPPLHFKIKWIISSDLRMPMQK